MNAKQSCGIEDRETGMEQWDIYSRMEYKEIRSMIEKNILLDSQKRDKYLKEKAEREKLEKLARMHEQRIEIMY